MARLCISLLGLAGGAAGFRAQEPGGASPALGLFRSKDIDSESSCTPPAAYRQELTNMMDLQYFTEMKVGGQKITGILDTGSFELVVFSKRCETCGMAGAYDPEKSTTFKTGDLVKVHSYGSGSCKSQGGTDEVVLGCYETPAQSMWLAIECKMPLLQAAGFQSIVGVGPPGQPEFTARETLKQLDQVEDQLRGANRAVPKPLQHARALAENELKEALKSKSLLESFGMSTFSTCLGRKPGSKAWMIWNDVTREGQPGTMKIPVAGNITWGIALQGLSMEFSPSADVDVSSLTELTVGCEKGCGAIVDTGTSLLAVPTSTYHGIANTIEKHMQLTDCSDLSAFPTLIISVAGHKLRLPPSSYIGTVSGRPSEAAAKYLHLRSMPGGGAAQCQLLLMDMGEELTQFGPMMILGMPLFREYYTTFDLGSGRGHRSIFVSKADDSCEPESEKKVSYSRSREGFQPRHVDLSKVRAPEWASRRAGITI